MKDYQKQVVRWFAVLAFCSSLYGQGLKLSQPSALGGGLVFTNLDRGNNPYLTEVGAGPGIEFFVKYNLGPKFFLQGTTGVQTVYDKMLTWENFKLTLWPTLEVKSGIALSPGSVFQPTLFAGLNAFGMKANGQTDRYFDAAVLLGAGAEYAFNEKTAFSLSGDYRYVFSADDPKPKFWVAKAGLSFALAAPGKSYKGEEIEYPMDEKEIASLNDLFKEEPPGGTKTTAEDDALSLLFQPDKGTAAEVMGTETSDAFSASENAEVAEYPDTEMGRLMASVDRLKKEMSQKSQLIDELQQQVRSNEKSIADLSGTLAGEASGLAGYGSAKQAEFKRRYAEALDVFYSKRYRDAIDRFSALIQNYPANILTSNCHYWIGECYNGMGDYRKAIDSFTSVFRYKSSYKLDDALIMSGVCYMKMGDATTAREQFQELVSRYPESEYAPKAMRFLGKL